MIKKTVVASVFLAICLFTLSASRQQPKAWEYKFQYQCDEKKANKLADEGWELVNMTASGSGMTTAINCASSGPRFKRTGEAKTNITLHTFGLKGLSFLP